MGPEDTWQLDDPSSSSWIDRGPSDSWRDGRRSGSTADGFLAPSDTWEPNQMIYPYDSHDLLSQRTTFARSPSSADEHTPYSMPIDPHVHDETVTTSVSEGGTSVARLRRSCKEYLLFLIHPSLSMPTFQLVSFWSGGRLPCTNFPF